MSLRIEKCIGLGAVAVLALAGCGNGNDRTVNPESSSSAVLAGTTFEGDDGNLVVDTTGNTDWTNAPNRTANDDLPSGKGDNSFGQGTKEDSASVSVVTGSIPPNKSDLSRFYVAYERAGSGDTFLYLAWERTNVLGSANMDFEINQLAQPDLTTTGAKTLNRSAGDLLITFDFTNGGGKPVLGLLTWVTSGATSQCYSSNALPCWGNRVDLSGLGEAEGAVNADTVTDPVANVTLAGLTFGEASVNLSAAGVFPPGQCLSFGSAFLKSRSSASFPAEVKDFIAPVTISVSNCGTINIKKVIDGTNTGLSGATFTVYSGVTADGTSLTCPSGGTSVGTCTTGSTGTCSPNPFTDLQTGTYCVEETTPPTGYFAAPAQSGTITAGGTLNFTFNDKPKYTLSVTKKDDGNNAVSGAVFKLYFGGTTANSCTDGTLIGTCTTNSTGACVSSFTNLSGGSYCIDETTVPAGYGKDSTLPATLNITSDTTVTYTNPRLRFKIITIVCAEKDNSLYSSLISFGGATAVASLKATDSTFTALGITQAQLCGLGGAAFGNKLVTTNPPGTGTAYSETINIGTAPAP